MLTDARLPMVRHVAVVAEQRFGGRAAGRCAAQPLYVDPPEAQAAGGRAAPAAGRMIGRATPACHAARTRLAAIHASAFPPREAWGADAIALQLALAGVFGLIDERGGMLLGRVAADEAEVLTLAVAPAVRRQGIATALLRAARAEIAARGGTALFLEVAVGNCRGAGAVPRESASSRWAAGAATTPIRRTPWCCV